MFGDVQYNLQQYLNHLFIQYSYSFYTFVKASRLLYILKGVFLKMVAVKKQVSIFSGLECNTNNVTAIGVMPSDGHLDIQGT